MIHATQTNTNTTHHNYHNPSVSNDNYTTTMAYNFIDTERLGLAE